MWNTAFDRKVGVCRGDGTKPKRGYQNPVGPWGPRKTFLSSKMMNSQPQHIQKREIVELQIIKYE